MIIAYRNDVPVAQWVAARIPHVGQAENFGQYKALGVIHQDQMIAGCVYHNYLPQYDHCEISFAADTPKFATRKVILELLKVPFEQYECRTVTLTVPHTAERVKRFVSGIGFKRRGCMPEFFSEGVHAEMYSMTRRDYDNMKRRYRHG